MDGSVKYIPASDGSGNASVVTIQQVRSAGATTIDGDTVEGLPAFFFASMGTPHTFTDPITGEEITIISEETAVDFAGYVDSGNIEIFEIAPGYVDGGSEIGDIVIIRPTTQWSDNMHKLWQTAHNDDGSLKDTALDDFFKPDEIVGDFVASGGIVALSSGLTGSFTDIVYYINGLRHTKSEANKLYTASRDTYVDIGDDGTVDYNAVTNGAAAPTLAADHIRVAKVVTSGSAITSVTQSGLDSLGNMIYPRNAANSLLYGAASASIASTQTTTSTSYTDLATVGPEVTVNVGVSGMLLVSISGFIGNNTADGLAYASFALSGANTLAASDANGLAVRQYSGSVGTAASRTVLLTGLSPGSTKVTMKYKAGSNTGSFGAATTPRSLVAIPL